MTNRENVDKYIIPERKKDKEKSIVSDDGLYKLNVSWYSCNNKPEDNYWDFSRGLLTEISTGKIIADIRRNYPDFWYCFVDHPNGNKYLLCGEDYQGYTVINCKTGERHDFLPEEAKGGFGFCWVEIINFSGTELTVCGCHWACPFENVTYDFSIPEKQPYPELLREYENYEDLEDEDEDLEND